jgi:hypothetical protein
MRRTAVFKWWKRFIDGETNVKVQNRLFHYPPEASGNGLQKVFEKWVERFKNYITCQGRYFEKETVTTLPQSFDSQ